MSETFKVGLVQMSMGASATENLSAAVSGIEDAAKAGANVICLPELFMSEYFCQTEDSDKFDLAECVPGATTETLGAVAKKLGVVIIASVFEKRAAGMYHNTAVIINEEGAVAGKYRKMHIPDDPGYYEKFYFTPGDLGFCSVKTSFGNVGVLICWDQWFPEAARITALKGADIIFYPTAIGWHPNEKDELGKKQLDAWQTVQRGHAIANGIYVAAVNRVGFEKNQSGGGIEFWGNSFMCDPSGEIIAQASDDSEVLVAEVDKNIIEETRRGWPFLRDRRIDAYGEIDSRFLDES